MNTAGFPLILPGTTSSSRLGLIGFIAGLVPVFIFRGNFGLPLILASIGMIYRLISDIKRMGKAPAGELLNFSPNTVTGILKTFSVPGVVESFYSFVVREERILPVILKQIYRSEDSLAPCREVRSQ